MERSADGITFKKVITADHTEAEKKTVYSWLDKNAAPGQNYYRIRSSDNPGSCAYSNIALVELHQANRGIRIYSNPVENDINLEFINMGSGLYHASLFNSNGEIIFVSSITHLNTTSLEAIRGDHRLIARFYYLRITGPTEFTTNLKMVQR